MCILCNKKYDVFSLARDGLHGLTIENCDKIELISLPNLRSLEVVNCPNLHTIHCQVVTSELFLDRLPELILLDVIETKDETDIAPFIRRISVSDCPKFSFAGNFEFNELVYGKGCVLAHAKYGQLDGTNPVIICPTYKKFRISVMDAFYTRTREYYLKNL